VDRWKCYTGLNIGQADRTVVGKAQVKKELLPHVGQYPELGLTTAKLFQVQNWLQFPRSVIYPTWR